MWHESMHVVLISIGVTPPCNKSNQKKTHGVLNTRGFLDRKTSAFFLWIENGSSLPRPFPPYSRFFASIVRLATATQLPFLLFANAALAPVGTSPTSKKTPPGAIQE